MPLDMLDFESDVLYFEEPLDPVARQSLERASGSYGSEEAENALLQAYFLAPEHPTVLVALYRYFYYQHRLEDALLVSERVLRIFAQRLELPEDWKELDEERLGSGVMISMTMVRFYMLALKGAGYLELRLGNCEAALERLEKVAELDSNDRLNVRPLIDVAHRALQKDGDSMVVAK